VISRRLSERAAALAADGTPFALATVVRAQKPTSVRPGDSAIVLPDGTIEGFVGGVCAEQSVRLHALRVLETNEALLLRIVPGPDDAPASEGAVTVQNPCLSGGAMEVFLEPRNPAPRIAVPGQTPIAGALARIGPEVGFEVGFEPAPGDLAVIAASHGRDELPALRDALESGVPYVALVASRRRGKGVLQELREAGVPDELLARIDTPAGFDIGARTPEEIAISILARVIAVRRSQPDMPAPARAEPLVAVDPVCGMEVAAVDASPHAEHEGRTVYFCCEGCREAFVAEPARYAAPH
jgi:xanthine dehydrogenase accessory factor